MLFYDGHLDREKAKLSYTQNTTSIAFVHREYYYKVNIVVDTRALYYMQKQKQKLDSELEQVRNNRDYKRPHCSGVFTRTIGIDCSYSIEGKDFLTTESFNEFWIILGTYATGSSTSALRLLEPATKLRKRAARLVRSYTASIGVLLSARDPTSAERNDPNNSGRFILTREAEDNATQLARRNGNP